MDDLIMRTLPYMPGAAGRYSGADRYTSGQGVARIDRTPLNYAARQAPPIPQGVAPAPVVAMGAPQAPATPYQSSTPGAARGESVGSLGLGGSSAGIPNMGPGGSSWLGNLDLSPKDAAATGWRVAGPAGAVAGGLLGWASSSARAADPTNPSSVNAVNGMDAQSDAAPAAPTTATAASGYYGGGGTYNPTTHEPVYTTEYKSGTGNITIFAGFRDKATGRVTNGTSDTSHRSSSSSNNYSLSGMGARLGNSTGSSVFGGSSDSGGSYSLSGSGARFGG